MASEIEDKNAQEELINEETPEEAEKVYRILKDEYFRHRGITVSIGTLHIDPKLTTEEVQELKEKEASKRAKPLLDFWEDYFLKYENQSYTGEIKTLVDRMKKYTRDLMHSIILHNTLIEMEDKLQRAKKKKQEKETQANNKKIQEEKRGVLKALNIHYKFDKETSEDKKCMEKLIWKYRQCNKKLPSNGSELYNWWLDNKDSTLNENKVKELVDDFYSSKARMERLIQLYKQHSNHEPKKAESLLNYWESIKVTLHHNQYSQAIKKIN